MKIAKNGFLITGFFLLAGFVNLANAYDSDYVSQDLYKQYSGVWQKAITNYGKKINSTDQSKTAQALDVVLQKIMSKVQKGGSNYTLVNTLLKINSEYLPVQSIVTSDSLDTVDSSIQSKIQNIKTNDYSIFDNINIKTFIKNNDVKYFAIMNYSDGVTLSGDIASGTIDELSFRGEGSIGSILDIKGEENIYIFLNNETKYTIEGDFDETRDYNVLNNDIQQFFQKYNNGNYVIIYRQTNNGKFGIYVEKINTNKEVNELKPKSSVDIYTYNKQEIIKDCGIKSFKDFQHCLTVAINANMRINSYAKSRFTKVGVGINDYAGWLIVKDIYQSIQDNIKSQNFDIDNATDEEKLVFILNSYPQYFGEYSSMKNGGDFGEDNAKQNYISLFYNPGDKLFVDCKSTQNLFTTFMSFMNLKGKITPILSNSHTVAWYGDWDTGYPIEAQNWSKGIIKNLHQYDRNYFTTYNGTNDKDWYIDSFKDWEQQMGFNDSMIQKQLTE